MLISSITIDVSEITREEAIMILNSMGLELRSDRASVSEDGKRVVFEQFSEEKLLKYEMVHIADIDLNPLVSFTVYMTEEEEELDEGKSVDELCALLQKNMGVTK